MPFVGTTIFSHVIPFVLGFFGIILITRGFMDDENVNLILGIVLFVIACISPFLILRVLML